MNQRASCGCVTTPARAIPDMRESARPEALLDSIPVRLLESTSKRLPVEGFLRLRWTMSSRVHIFDARTRMLSCSTVCLSVKISSRECELSVERISVSTHRTIPECRRDGKCPLVPKRFFRSRSPRRILSSRSVAVPTRGCRPGRCGDRQHVRSLPLGVHTGDHVGDQVGDPVRSPPPPAGEDAGQRVCTGIRWYPRLAWPQAGRHIGTGWSLAIVPDLAPVSPIR